MAGIYIHIPFCKSRCRYCDFFSTTQLDKQQAYINAVIKEWEKRKEQWLADSDKKTIRTIYIGGGTPSLLPIDNLQKLLQAIFSSIDTTTIEEITLEANPGDFTAEKVRAWQQIGINRLSIGIQSFQNRLLQLIGRRHDNTQAKQAIAMAQNEGITNISIDLMYALPTQTMEEWKTDIEEALRLEVPHISTYGLIYEEGTPLFHMLENGEIEVTEENEEIQMYDYLVRELTNHGYEHYEVSNFALPNKYSRHNSSYWNNTAYLGLGAGAHSYDGESRWWNIADIDKYIEQANNNTILAERELLTEEQHHTEQIMLGLRTNRGIPTKIIDIEKAKKYIHQGLLKQVGENIVATTEGFHILNRIIEDLI